MAPLGDQLIVTLRKSKADIKLTGVKVLFIEEEERAPDAIKPYLDSITYQQFLLRNNLSKETRFLQRLIETPRLRRG